MVLSETRRPVVSWVTEVLIARPFSEFEMKTLPLKFLAGALLTMGVLSAVRPLRAASPGPPTLFSPPMSKRIVHYKIRVKLQPESHRLKGDEVIHWKNTTAETVSEARFHLYMNAFANDQSVFMKESSGHHRSFTFKKKNWGYCRVGSIAQVTGDGVSLPLEQVFQGEDRTVMAVKLAEPVEPGGETIFSVSFEDQLPKIFARTGYAGDFVMAGQWFPKLGVYQEGKGWNCHTFHLNSEFFADFGVYDVSITVPKSWVVGATGILWRESAGKKDNRFDYHAEDVHDFAWTASPRFLDLRDEWENVKIRVLMQPENSRLAPRYFAAVKTALSWFKLHLMKYPYSEITIVDAPYNGLGAGGMEYPTLITAMASPFIPKSFLIPEITVVHEFGHQYWYGMSANNEFEEAWLDEGINSYCEKRIMDEWYGAHNSVFNGFMGIHLGDGEVQRMGYLRIPDADPMKRDSWKYISNGSYSDISYDKSALVLTTLENLIGRKEMDALMKGFFNSVKFTHTTTSDFINYFCSTVGEKYRPLLEKLIYGTGTVDFSVMSVRNKPAGLPEGYDLKVNPPKPYPDAGKGKKNRKSDAYDSTVKVMRRGTLVLPVDIRIGFKDGKIVLEHWNSRDKFVIFRYSGAKVVKVEIDPDGRVPLDLDRSNNGWIDEADKLPTRSLATRFRLVEQALFQALALLL